MGSSRGLRTQLPLDYGSLAHVSSVNFIYQQNDKCDAVAMCPVTGQGFQNTEMTGSQYSQ